MRRVEILFIALALAGASPASAQMGVYDDEPAPSSNRPGVRISGQARSQLIPERYVVRRGDTLWDVTGRFYGNPWEWPRVWSYNPEITNPHWIYPLDQIPPLAARKRAAGGRGGGALGRDGGGRASARGAGDGLPPPGGLPRPGSARAGGGHRRLARGPHAPRALRRRVRGVRAAAGPGAAGRVHRLPRDPLRPSASRARRAPSCASSARCASTPTTPSGARRGRP